MKNRIFSFVKEKNSNYIDGYCKEQNGLSPSQIDPIELLIYIIERIEGDNNWLVDKLAELEEDKRRLLEKSHLDQLEEDILNGDIFSNLIKCTTMSEKLLEDFSFQREEFLATLETTAQTSASMPPQRITNHSRSISVDKEN